MNYKKIIKNQNIRFAILNCFSWIPDKTMIKIQYRIKTGRKLNLKNPQRYTEKLQWYKLYYRNPIMHKCVDKYEVREYVKAKGLDTILNDLYGVYDNPEDIDFDSLPNKFVIKTTAGSGGQNVYICEDKSKLDKKDLINKLNYWLKQNPKKSFGREWAYQGIRNRLIIEKYIESKNNGLVDYKFFCFNGKVEYLYVISDRVLGKSTKLGIYSNNYEKLNFYRGDEGRQENKYKKPICFDKMIEYSEIISKDFPHARVDFYEDKGKAIFGEITFYDGSGYMKYEPDNFDYIIAKKWIVGDIYDK
jgi:hypothetical protein